MLEDIIKKIPFGSFAVLVFLLSVIISYLTVPQISILVRKKGLVDTSNDRSSHKGVVPTMGGVSFFLSLIISLFFIDAFDVNGVGISIVAGTTVLFFVGMKDDLICVSPRVKVIGQILVTLFLLKDTGFFMKSFDGFMFIGEIPFILSVFLSFLMILVLVNSYNLIDGINGSASMVGISIFVLFAFIFYRTNMDYFFLLSIVCIGFLAAFLRYNLSKSKRIFMGDTGSMIVGYIIGIMTMRFMAMEREQLRMVGILPVNKVILILGLVFVPFVDTLRVFVLRVMKGVSPFKPDRNHIHHVMIDFMGLTHASASLILAVMNTFAFFMLYYLDKFVSPIILAITFILMVAVSAIVLFLFNRSYKVRKNKLKILKSITKVRDKNLSLF